MARLLTIAVALFMFASVSVAKPAHALDKRLKLAFKTAAYGAGAGFLIGAGTYAMGLGDWKNMFMGASSGMYAGLALAGYLILTQDDYVAEKKRMQRPYAPRKPVGPDDWEEEDDEGVEDHVPPEESRLQRDTARLLAVARGRSLKAVEVSVWAPVVSFRF